MAPAQPIRHEPKPGKSSSRAVQNPGARHSQLTPHPFPDLDTGAYLNLRVYAPPIEARPSRSPSGKALSEPDTGE